MTSSQEIGGNSTPTPTAMPGAVYQHEVGHRSRGPLGMTEFLRKPRFRTFARGEFSEILAAGCLASNQNIDVRFSPDLAWDRVLGASGKPTGNTYGLPAKSSLLELEKALDWQ